MGKIVVVRFFFVGYISTLFCRFTAKEGLYYRQQLSAADKGRCYMYRRKSKSNYARCSHILTVTYAERT